MHYSLAQLDPSQAGWNRLNALRIYVNKLTGWEYTETYNFSFKWHHVDLGTKPRQKQTQRGGGVKSVNTTNTLCFTFITLTMFRKITMLKLFATCGWAVYYWWLHGLTYFFLSFFLHTGVLLKKTKKTKQKNNSVSWTNKMKQIIFLLF